MLLNFATVILFLVAAVNAQNCGKITADDLGDTNAPSTTGLVALRLMDGETSSLVQIIQFNIVCEAASTIRDRIRGASVVVNYTTNGAMVLSQFDLNCVGTSDSVWTISDDVDTVTTPPDANLMTVTRTDCSICVHPTRPGANTIADSHCGGI